MHQHLCLFAFLAGLMLQDPTPEALIKRLRWSDPKDREEAAAKLAAGGSAVLPLLEKALSETKEPEILGRIDQVRARIRLRLHTPALDDAFSAPFKRVAPDLINRLRNPTPEVLLDALEASTGLKAVIDLVLGRHVLVAGTRIPEAIPADAIVIYRIILSVLPPVEQSGEWKPVKFVMGASAHLFKTASLLEDSLIHLEDRDVEFRRVAFQLSATGQRRRFIPVYLRMLESPYSDVQSHVALKLSTMNPGETAPAIAAKIDRTGGLLRANLLESLARTGDPRWKGLFLQNAEDPDPVVQKSGVRALALLDPPAAVPHVLRLLDSRDSQLLQAGIQASSCIPDPRVSQALERIALESSDVIAASQAVYSLALCQPKNLSEVLEKTLRHSSVAVRNAAAASAYSVRDEKIIRILVSLLDDPEGVVQRSAASSLDRLKVKGNEEKIHRLLDSMRSNAAPSDPASLLSLLDLLEGPNEQAALEFLMRFRCPGPCREIQDLVITWPTDRNPTVKEVLQTAATALKTKGVALKADLAPVDELPRIRGNSTRMVMSLLYWLIPSSLGQEYGWYLEEGTLSLLPIDEARRSWREWAAKQTEKK